MRRRSPFPGVSVATDRHGKRRFRLRRTIRGRSIDCYLPGPYASAEFRAAYEEAVEGARIATRRVQPGTFAHLIVSYLDSAAYRSLEAGTRRDVRGRLDWTSGAAGSHIDGARPARRLICRSCRNWRESWHSYRRPKWWCSPGTTERSTRSRASAFSFADGATRPVYRAVALMACGRPARGVWPKPARPNSKSCHSSGTRPPKRPAGMSQRRTARRSPTPAWRSSGRKPKQSCPTFP